MEKNAYYIQVGNLSKEDIYAGTNKREAIKKGKKIALEKKTSCTLVKCVEDEGDLVVKYIAILEFPNYLRDCQLDARDILVNSLD